MKCVLLVLLVLTGLPFAMAKTPEGKQKLVLIAGAPSHPPLMHEFRAGTMLLQASLGSISDLIVERHELGWVTDEATFDDADAVVIYADGGPKHPAVQEGRLALLQTLMDRGVGFGCMHYGVEVVAEEAGSQFLEWLGGHYEYQHSCNPIWEPSFREFPEHPVTRGVKPFAIQDEWYFNMRFRPAFGEGIEAVTAGASRFVPLLVATPSDAVRGGPYVYPKGPYAHIQAQSGEREAMMWAVERSNGGRSFGFTGGHFHLNWGKDEFRKAVLNALVWVSGVEVPEEGVESVVTEAALAQNLDAKPEPKKKGAQLETPVRFQRGAVVSAGK